MPDAQLCYKTSFHLKRKTQEALSYHASLATLRLAMFLAIIGANNSVNMSMQSPKGRVENVLVKIHKFIFLVDFVILDIIDDNKVPIILGRPMLATAHTRIDVFGGKIYLEVDVIDDFGRPEDLVELLKNDDINRDLGDFLQDNDLLPNFDAPKAISLSPSRLASINKDPFKEFQDSDSNMGRIRALEQETQDLDMENKQMKNLKASNGVTTLQELRLNQIKEEKSQHYDYGVTASLQLHGGDFKEDNVGDTVKEVEQVMEDSDSDEVEDVYDETANFMASGDANDASYMLHANVALNTICFTSRVISKLENSIAFATHIVELFVHI
ncbi:homeodomain-like protein [Tanacetum coccineum]